MQDLRVQTCCPSSVSALSWAVSFLSDLCTPFASRVRDALRGDHALVLSMGYDITADTSTDVARRNWLAANLCKKALWLDYGSDAMRETACFEGWKEDERLNRLSNARLRERSSSVEYTGDSLIHEMSRKIATFLGALDLDEVFKDVGFSQGSSTRLPRRKGQPHNKIGGKPHVTASALPYACALVRSSPSWTAYCFDYCGFNLRDWFEVVPGGEWFTVPKSAKTFRSCEKQPDMNLILQKGVGNFIRKRLRRVGIDLNDQSRNALLALSASTTNTLSTLDLKSASNSVVRELVKRLLPPEWFDLLDALRCEWVKVKGSWHRLEMFSSMGNGFTFELESLIFWAASAVLVDQLDPSVGDTRFSIYGDDIIVPTACAGFLIEGLEYMGFRVNWEKSFMDGPFRESCGMHAYKGVEITPFYLEEDLSHRHEAIRVANKLRQWSAVDGICDPRYEKSYRKIAAPLSKYKGPSTDGDICLHSPTFPRKSKVWEMKVDRRVNNDPDRCEAASIVALLRLSQGVLATAPVMSIRQQGDRILFVTESSLTESTPGGYTSERRVRGWMRDSNVPCWLSELAV